MHGHEAVAAFQAADIARQVSFLHFLQSGTSCITHARDGYEAAEAFQAFDFAFQAAARHGVSGLPRALAQLQASFGGNDDFGDGNGGTSAGSDA